MPNRPALANGYGTYRADPAARARARSRRRPHRPRADDATTRSSRASAGSAATRTRSPSRAPAATAAAGSPTSASSTASRRPSRLPAAGRASSRARSSTSSAPATAWTSATAAASSSPATSASHGRHRDSRAGARRAGLPAVHLRRARTGRRTSATSAQNTFRDLRQASFSISNNTTWLKGRHSVRVRRHLHAQLREGRLLHRRERVEGPVQLQRLGHRQRVRRFPARPAQHRARAAQHARRPADGHRLERLGAVRAGRLEAVSRS